MEEKNKTVTSNDILKHYLSSIVVYGVILLFIVFCPILNEKIENPYFNYITFFILYYISYVVFAYPIYLKTKPKSLLTSRNVAIVDYIKRQFSKCDNEQRLKNIEPRENEKQAMVILFMKAFFGVYCITVLCNKYLPSIDYDISFIKEMTLQAFTYTQTEGILNGLVQFIDDTSDMWLTLIAFATTLIFAVSYLTESHLFKNKIKSVDTSFLGIISCIMCYYPVTILTNKVIYSYTEDLIPVDNFILRLFLNIFIVAANIISLIAIVKLGTKSGNLTNRGIVTGFPYNIVRHPNYSMQMLYLILTTIPLYFGDFLLLEKILFSVGTIGWIYVYYLRSITEERHLIKDCEYQKYMQTVKYMFIPKIF